MILDKTLVENRIKNIAKNTDSLIAKLDTLLGRIETANSNDNKELVAYYENQFNEVSVEFMDGVESMIDGWYELRGEKRPPAEDEDLSDEALEQIHTAVVNIIHDMPYDTGALIAGASVAAPLPVRQTEQLPVSEAPKHKVDIKG